MGDSWYLSMGEIFPSPVPLLQINPCRRDCYHKRQLGIWSHRNSNHLVLMTKQDGKMAERQNGKNTRTSAQYLPPTYVVHTEGSRAGWKFLVLAALAPQAGCLPTNHWAVTVFSQVF